MNKGAYINELFSFTANSFVQAISLPDNPRWLYTIDYQGQLIIWKIARKDRCSTINQRELFCYQIEQSKQLLIVRKSNHLSVYCLNSKKLIRKLISKIPLDRIRLKRSNFVYSFDKNSVQVIDIEIGLAQISTLGRYNWIQDLDYSSYDELINFSSFSDNLKVWNTRTMKLYEFQLQDKIVAYYDKQKSILLSLQKDSISVIRIWDYQQKQFLSQKFVCPEQMTQLSATEAILAASSHSQIIVWDYGTAEQILTYRISYIIYHSLSNDGTHVAYAKGYQPELLKIEY